MQCSETWRSTFLPVGHSTIEDRTSLITNYRTGNVTSIGPGLINHCGRLHSLLIYIMIEINTFNTPTGRAKLHKLGQGAPAKNAELGVRSGPLKVLFRFAKGILNASCSEFLYR